MMILVGMQGRNEIKLKEGTILSYGGSESFQSPKALYSKEVNGLLKQIGVNVDSLAKRFDVNFYPDLKLSRGVYFSKSEFGVDKVVSGNPGSVICDDVPKDKLNARDIQSFINDFPMNDKDKQDLINLFQNKQDYFAGKSLKEKEKLMLKTSYKDFLKNYVKLSDEAIKFFEGMTDDFMALGIDAVSCSDARIALLPGFDGMGLKPLDAENLAEIEEPYIYHCADGNASVARLIVKKLIPSICAGGDDMDSITLARFDYSKLDNLTHNVRIRLNSTAINAENIENGVLVTYINKGKSYRVKAKKVIMANYNAMIPYIIPTLPKAQKDALSQNVKTSLIYTKVIIKNWQPFIKLGVHEIYSPRMPYCRTKLDFPVNIGGYKHPRDRKKPICVHMVCCMESVARIKGIELDGLNARDRARVNRHILLDIPFKEHEAMIKGQLQGMLGSAGFDANRDISTIVLNRWGHCYSYTPNPLFDDMNEAQKTMKLAKKPFKNIVIANSDSAYSAYMHSAIDEAYRAVHEL